ncbi:MAG: bacterial Ig-like domain-containing protein, partial [Lachnospiraceae bacterium]|nr:bacterial Ig-like domain-containing protein [Lachnospiraceae bacterium]
MKRENLCKKGMAVLMSVAMGITLLPSVGRLSVVQAEEYDARSINLVTDGKIAGIGNPVSTDSASSGSSDSQTQTETGWSGNYVYFGRNGSVPITFRVLDPSSQDAYGINEAAMLLDADTVLGQHSFRENENASWDWKNSSMQTYLNSTASGGFLATAFTSIEQGAIAKSTKAVDSDTSLVNAQDPNQSDPDPSGSTDPAESYTNPALEGEQIFLLDVDEVSKEQYGYIGEAQRKKSGEWWLRSSHKEAENASASAGAVIGDTGAIAYSTGVTGGVSPALNLLLSKVFFTFAEKKPDSFTVTKQMDSTGKAWGLTLKDGKDAPFTASVQKVNGQEQTSLDAIYEGQQITVEIKKSSALSSTAYDQISAMLVYKTDNVETVMAYGKIADWRTLKPAGDQSSGDTEATTGNITITIPDDVYKESGTYRLELFAEKINSKEGAFFSDYASDTVAIGSGLTMSASPKPKLAGTDSKLELNYVGKETTASDRIDIVVDNSSGMNVNGIQFKASNFGIKIESGSGKTDSTIHKVTNVEPTNSEGKAQVTIQESYADTEYTRNTLTKAYLYYKGKELGEIKIDSRTYTPAVEWGETGSFSKEYNGETQTLGSAKFVVGKDTVVATVEDGKSQGNDITCTYYTTYKGKDDSGNVVTSKNNGEADLDGGAPKKIGTYMLEITVPEKTINGVKYGGTTVNHEVSITTRKLTITVKNQTCQLGESPKITGGTDELINSEGLLAGHTISDVHLITASTLVTNTAGTTEIDFDSTVCKIQDTNNANVKEFYSFNVNKGTLTITGAPTITIVTGYQNWTCTGGQTYDVSKMFQIVPETAGKDSTYTLEGGSGEGILSESGSLSVNKPGTFEIKVTTKKTDVFESNTQKVTLTVSQGTGTGTVKVGTDNSVIYGDPISPQPQSSTNDTTSVTYQYKKKGAGDNTYTSDPPKLPGDYTIQATFLGTPTYTAATATADFTIKPRPLTIRAKSQEIIYGENIAQGLDQITFISPVNGETIREVKLSTTDWQVTDTGVIKPSDVKIQASDDVDVTDRYEITYETNTLKITRRPLSITPKEQTVKWGHDLNLKNGDQLNVQVDNLAEGDELESIEFVANNKKLTTDSTKGKIELKNAGIKRDGTDVTDNYAIQYQAADALTVIHDDELKPTSLTAYKTRTAYKTGDTLNQDDITVTATYADTYTEQLQTGKYKVNTTSVDTDSDGKIDTDKAGEQTITVSCDESDDSGADTTVSAQIPLRVYTPVEVTQAPEDTAITAGTTAALSVKASGTELGSHKITYQWQKSTDQGANWTKIEGAVEPKYTTPVLNVTDNGTQYRCVVTNGEGDALTTVSSTAAVVTVNPIAVHNTGSDREVVYDGSTIDVSQLFTFDPHAGTPAYTLVEDEGTGEGTLDGKNLTVQKTGTFKLRAGTAANGNYAKGTAVEGNLTVQNGTIAYEEAENWEGTYDGRPHSISVKVNTPSDAVITYSTDTGSNKQYKTANPTFTNAGTYTVYYQISRNNYDTVTGSATVTIDKRALTIAPKPQSIQAGGTLDKYAYEADLVAGDRIEKMDFTTTPAEYDKIYENGTISVSNAAQIVNAAGEDVTANYAPITYAADKAAFHITHNTTLAPSAMTVTVKLPEKIYRTTDDQAGQTLKLEEELAVTVSYTDGYEKVLKPYTGDGTAQPADTYTTNIASLDMTKEGTKELTITYQENGGSVEEKVTLTVKAPPTLDTALSDQTVGAGTPVKL